MKMSNCVHLLKFNSLYAIIPALSLIYKEDLTC